MSKLGFGHWDLGFIMVSFPLRRIIMTTAYLLIEAVSGQEEVLINELNKLQAVKQVHLVTGPYDVIAFIDGPDLKSLGDTIVKNIQSTGYVSRTLTCIVVD